MYNLFVANTSKEWNGDPFILETDRCISAGEYTDEEIAEQYGSLSSYRLIKDCVCSCVTHQEINRK